LVRSGFAFLLSAKSPMILRMAPPFSRSCVDSPVANLATGLLAALETKHRGLAAEKPGNRPPKVMLELLKV